MANPAGSKIPKGYAAGSLQQFNPDQMELFKRLFSSVSPDSQLAGLSRGDDAAFAPQEERAMRDFQEFSGQLGSRYSQLAPGAMSSQRGSGFKNAASQGAQDFASKLSQQRQELQRQALGDLMGISHMLLGHSPSQNFLVEKQQKTPGWHNLLAGGLPIAGGIIGGLIPGAGPMGAAAGSAIGSSFASGITGRQSGQTDWSSIMGLPRTWGS